MSNKSLASLTAAALLCSALPAWSHHGLAEDKDGNIWHTGNTEALIDGGLLMSATSPDLTLEEVRDRIRVAGLHIPEERLALVHGLLRDALRPIRALDTREARTLEPAPTFDAAAERDRHAER